MKRTIGPYKHLLPAQVAELLRLFTAGVTYTRISEQLNIDPAAVSYHARKHRLTGARRNGRPNEYAENATSFRCGACHETLPTEAFGKRTNFTRGGGRPVRWRCHACDTVSAAVHRYRIPWEQAARLLTQPLCDICQQPQHSRRNGVVRAMFIDHDHTTGRIRGAICEGCNSGLGLMDDSVDRMTGLQTYLQRPALELPPATITPNKTMWMRHIERTYKLAINQYQQLVAQQNGRCSICLTFKPTAKFPRLLVDHCHDGGHVRGLLCYCCNLAVGKFGNDVRRVEQAKTYLEAHGQTT